MKSSNSSNSSNGDLGNTKTKSQDSPAKRWVFTLNNYTEEEFNSIREEFSSNSSKYSIGREVGEEGTPHLQGYVELESKARFSYFKKIMPRAHIEKAKKNRATNITYTQKEGSYIQNFKEEVYIEEPNPKLMFLKELIDKYERPKGDRLVHCVVDKKGGLGKTEFARYIVMKTKGAIVLSGKGADMKNAVLEYVKTNNESPKTIIIDVPRSCSDYISYQGIEEVKNMFFYSGKYEGGMVCGNKPFVLLMMNEYPDMEKLSEDRWRIYDTF